MGRQVGLIKVKGNIGGVSFYKSNGEDLARVANGPSKNKIQNDANFVRTRENNQEFGGAAMAGKALRYAMGAALLTVADNKLTARLTALFKELSSKSPGVRGKRAIHMMTQTALFINFEFNKKLTFNSVFSAPFVSAVPSGRGTITVDIAPFNVNAFVHAPAGATHFKVFSVLGLVPDFTYNDVANSYEPLFITNANLSTVSYSPAISLSQPVTAPISLANDLQQVNLLPGVVNVIHAMGVEFYQRVDNVDYVLAQGNAMKIVAVL